VLNAGAQCRGTIVVDTTLKALNVKAVKEFCEIGALELAFSELDRSGGRSEQSAALLPMRSRSSSSAMLATSLMLSEQRLASSVRQAFAPGWSSKAKAGGGGLRMGRDNPSAQAA
jgi:hypothetical protein